MTEEIVIFNVMEGSRIVKVGDFVAIIGVPPEVIKAIINRNLPRPNLIILPDKNIADRKPQCCLEFPLYQFLFIGKGLEKGLSLRIAGTKRQVENGMRLLSLSLLGPSADELHQLDISLETVATHIETARHFALKEKSGEIMPLTSMVQPYIFHNGVLKTDGIAIRKRGVNEFEFTTKDDRKTVNINFKGRQIPPYDIIPNMSANDLSKFSVEILGGTTGFNPKAACSGMVLNYNGNYILVDAIPFIEHHLEARGISINQIQAIFLTHIHDDHCNLTALMLADRKIDLITVPEIYDMAMKKCSYLVDLPVETVKTFFNFREVRVGKPLDYYGLEIDAHYNVHSIPTVGARFTIRDLHNSYSITVIGDNQSMEEIKSLTEKKIVPPSIEAELSRRFLEPVDLLFSDGGGGILHGTPKDAMHSQASRVIFMHVDKLSPEYHSKFAAAQSGKIYNIISTDFNYGFSMALHHIWRTFPGIDPVWASILVSEMAIRKLNADDLVLRQGDSTRGLLYIILSGVCSVFYHDGQKNNLVAFRKAGEFVGEMSIVTGEAKRSATVKADTPVILCEMSEKLFKTMIESENLGKQLIKTWETRRLLEQFPAFRIFSNVVNDQIAARAAVETVANSTRITEQGQPCAAFYIIIKGTVEVRRNNRRIDELAAGDFFGEVGVFIENHRSTQIVATSKCEMLKIKAADMKRLIIDHPVLHYEIIQTVYARKY